MTDAYELFKKVRAGDLIKFRPRVREGEIPQPTKVLAKIADHHLMVVYSHSYGWSLRDEQSSLIPKAIRAGLVSLGEESRFWYLNRSQLLEIVEEAEKLPPLDRESTLYDCYRHDLRKRIQEEEESRPSDSWSEFL